MKEAVTHPAVALLQKSPTPLRTSDFVAAGINRMTLHRLVEKGEIERVGAGLFRLPEFTSEYADWAAVALRYPDAVICTQSAATFHRTTQDLVGEIHVMRPHKDSQRSTLASSFPVGTRVVRVRNERGVDPFSYGIEENIIDNIPVKITDLERTLVDMFRFSAFNPSLRSGQGHVSEESLLVCMERTLSRRGFSIDKLTDYAEKAGIRRAMSPLLKTSLHIVSSLPEEHYNTAL